MYLHLFILFHVYVCVPDCTYVHYVSTATHRGQKRASGPLDLELHTVVNLKCRCLEHNPGSLKK